MWASACVCVHGLSLFSLTVTVTPARVGCIQLSPHCTDPAADRFELSMTPRRLRSRVRDYHIVKPAARRWKWGKLREPSHADARIVASRFACSHHRPRSAECNLDATDSVPCLMFAGQDVQERLQLGGHLGPNPAETQLTDQQRVCQGRTPVPSKVFAFLHRVDSSLLLRFGIAPRARVRGGMAVLRRQC